LYFVSAQQVSQSGPFKGVIEKEKGLSCGSAKAIVYRFAQACDRQTLNQDEVGGFGLAAKDRIVQPRSGLLKAATRT